MSNLLSRIQTAQIRAAEDLVIQDLQSKGLAPSALPPHQQRVVDEKAALDEKLVMLNNFFTTFTFESMPQRERHRLARQELYMRAYSNVLGERIAAFGETQS